MRLFAFFHQIFTVSINVLASPENTFEKKKTHLPLRGAMALSVVTSVIGIKTADFKGIREISAKN